MSQKNKPASPKRNIITDALVLSRTGHDMEHWFLFADKQHARGKSHAEIYQLFNDMIGLDALSEWNKALLATSYMWSRELRERGEKKDGFEISVSKTINVPLPVLFESWHEEKKRKSWLPEELKIRKSTINKSIRADWTDNVSRLSIDFYAKSADKAQVVVQHLKLKDTRTAEKMKAVWSEKLAGLKEKLEG